MKKVSVFFVILFAFAAWCFHLSTQAFAITNPLTKPVSVTATVPSYFLLQLTGWTSPYAQVELNMSQALFRVTRANEEGEFTFNLSLPLEVSPFCLIATDVSDISSHPLCIPPPPPEITTIVKEVVMPPTLRIDKGKVARGETIPASGYTTPDSPVIPFLFEEKSRFQFLWKIFSHFPIASVYASEVPKPYVKSNQSGFYQFNLPTTNLGKNRIFIGSLFREQPSPKSTTLTFDILSWWRMILFKIWLFLTNLFLLLWAFVTNLKGVLLIEVIILITIAFFVLKKRQKKEIRETIRVRF